MRRARNKHLGIESGHESYPLEMHHGAFIREGLMVAMPLGFPGTTTPVDPDDSFITALTVRRDDPYETIYGGTSGRRGHLFFGWLRGVTGVIVDLGCDGSSTETAGIACTRETVVAAVNGHDGGRLLRRHHQPISYDCIQEWTMDMKPFTLGAGLPGTRILDIQPDPAAGGGVIGTSTAGVFTWDGKCKTVRTYPEIPVTRIAGTASGDVFGIDAGGRALLIEKVKGRIRARSLATLEGSFREATWSASNPAGAAYLASDDGTLFLVSRTGRARRIGRTHLKPVTCMTALPDGRLFGFCGNGISNMFVYEPREGKTRDLGVALSVLNRRRYGYVFSRAVTNRDGHVLFGERDRGGHLWIYFPSTGPRRTKWR